MSKQDPGNITMKWAALGTGAKAAVIIAASIVLVGGISLPVYLNHRNRQALILAEQQEQERLAAEHAEAERIAAEEQARLEQEVQAEAVRLAAEEEAARLEAERVEQERIAAEEEEQARRQAEAAVQQESTSDESANGSPTPATDSGSAGQPGTEDSNRQDPREEPAGGVGKEMADAMGAVWDPDEGGWVYTTGGGTRELIRPNGALRSLDHPIPFSQPDSGAEDDRSQGMMEEPSSGIGKEQADRMGAIWIPELEGWAYISVAGEYVLIRANGATRSLDGAGENLTIAKRYLG